MDNLKSTILKHLYFNGTQSIAEVSDGIGKSIPLITRSMNELMDDGLITEVGLRASTGGRRAMNFALHTAMHGCLLAVAVDQYSVSIGAFDIENKPVTTIYKSAIELKREEEVYAILLSMIDDVLASLSERSVLAIGITLPGFVDAQTGVNNSYSPVSPLYALRDNIRKRYHLPAYIENDSSAIAIAEQYFGAAKSVEDALVINLNWGVGLGMIIQGGLFRGHSGFAGEFSHIPLADESRLCSCGKKGCLEVEASLHCAIDDIQEALANGERSYLEDIFSQEKGIQFEHLLIAYEKGDQLTIRAIKKIAHMLGKGIATLIHILNPQKIIVSGRGAAFGEALVPQILSAVQEYCIPRLARQTKLEISDTADVQILASACIAVQQLEWNKKIKNQLSDRTA